ncbi:gamma-tubulin complex, DGRIP84/SPC97 component [Fomitiporia mediterranea MF3/22]|uniref:gamma-tubulin complex, DGRIP84/SPC97 component n=1 Tax=Fomitiporia mediterranea (strain MF3/22) TaxID=694068 RepID=UPI00044074DA|nr:gamma-tubulin complex, DGRIP84/SPC97 component [Fomitiporia mediterranea MF3/22]EJD07888.1 gamma-tubulin complex, DGRIP84/SPC97 component [Fomitiporia mediterranea MF3/22]
MEPFTPKRRSRIRRDKLTLSAKQYSKITGTIASVRRNRVSEVNEVENPVLGELSEPSFIAEKSFVDAPLNSRVPIQLVTTKTKGKQKAEPLDRVPLEVQEALILEDLLFVLMGTEGTYITYPSDVSQEDEDPNHGLRFVVAPSLDPSLRDLVERVLPLATYYTAITTFIQDRSHLEYGLVNHALCAAIRDMLKDYHTLLSQLEHAFQHSPSFSLQKLWFYVHPTLHTLSLIHGLISEIVDAEEPPESGSDSDESEEDPEEQARNEALGLGGAKFKALVSEMKKSTGGSGVPAGPAKGGEVLSILHERMQRMSGDPSALALHRALMRAAGRPYAEMLVAWTRSGKLDDPYEEFCVKESKFIDKANLNVDYTDEYWERRYTLRDGSTPSGTAKTLQAGIPSPRMPGGRLPCGACIPPLLESWKHKVLLSGKYLNVLQECGKEIRRPNTLEDEDFAMENDKFYKAVEDAYAFADSTLVKILVHDQQLIPRLRSLKHYFLLSQSAFLTHFLDAAHSELKKSARGANIDKLQSLFDVALNTDGCTFVSEGEPTFKEDVKVSLGDSGLYDKLQKILSERGAIGGPENMDTINDLGNDEEKRAKGKDEKDTVKFLASSAFQLDYKVNFPLSLVISRTSIVRYQFLFRFLFHVRRIEQALLGIWTEHTTVPWRDCTTFSGAEEKYRDISHWCRCLFLQRARMLAFVQQLLAFVTSEVIEPNWRRLEASLARVGTVEALFRVHLDFVDTCLKECMLTNGRLIQAIEKILTTCDTFAQYGSAFTKSLKTALETDDPETIQRERTKRWEFLKKFTKNFEHWYRHVDRVQYDASSGNGALLPLYSRLSSIQSTSSLDQL